MSTDVADAGPPPFAVPPGKTLAEIPLDQLDLSPRNKRKDYAITPEFRASLEAKQEEPLIVFPAPADAAVPFWVYDGNRRLQAARADKRPSLTCIIDTSLAADLVAQFTGQITTARQRKPLTALEEAAALFDAAEAGAKRASLARATGLSRASVAAGIKAGGLSEQAREVSSIEEHSWTLDELAMLADLDDDPDALAEVATRVGNNQNARHAIERVMVDRREAAEYADLMAQLERDKVPITDDLPEGAARISAMASKLSDFDPETHGQCPGHGVFFNTWAPRTPVYYCTRPIQEHGYTPPPPINATGTSGAGKTVDPEQRRIVIAGNKAWTAAGNVRQDWVTQLLARASAPKLVLPFLAQMLVTMPEPLGDRLGTVRRSELYDRFAGTSHKPEAIATAKPSRLPLMALLPIAVAFEHQMTAAGESKSTWRTDKWSPCHPRDAAIWIAFLMELGYPPAPIELAIVHGQPYAGDDIDYPAAAAREADAPSGEPVEDPSAAPADTSSASPAVGTDTADALEPAA